MSIQVLALKNMPNILKTSASFGASICTKPCNSMESFTFNVLQLILVQRDTNLCKPVEIPM